MTSFEIGRLYFNLFQEGIRTVILHNKFYSIWKKVEVMV